MLNLCCQICSTFFSLSIFGMLNHLIQVHRNDPDLHFTCEVSNCYCTFTKVFSYKSHLQRNHSDIDLKSPYSPDIENMTNTAPDEAMEIQHEEMDVCGLHEDQLEDHAESNRRQNALYILKTKETNLLTQKCVDNIVENSNELVKNTVQVVKSGLQHCLNSAGIEFDEVPGLKDLFAEDNPISNPFGHVSTKYKQVEYFKEHFGLVEPQRITLGHTSKWRRSGTKYKEFLKDDEIIYVPLLKSLEKMLNTDSIFNEVHNGHQRNDDIIEDVCDAQLFKTHPLFSTDSTALQLMLYYDELEIANPLGSKAGKHKLGVVYFTLGNVAPKHRSQLNAIQLLLISTTPVIKKYGIDAVLEPFMNDLEYIEQDGGYQFMVKDEPQSFSGTIVFVSGDNLGSQLVGGFKEGSGAHLKCRHCMGASDDIKRMFLEKNFTLRTRDGHDHQCQSIDQDEQLGKTYGVRRRSILCNSRYYHVVDGLPGDAMHDILEGVLQYECKEMLKEFVYQDKYFTLDQLNQRLSCFNFGYYNDKNKPSPITRLIMKSENNSLRQKAAQMWCLAKFLPLVIGGAVPIGDERWQHFLLLLKIVDIVFSPTASISDLAILEGFIEEYLWMFTRIYPGRSVIPKMHYMIHYPAHIYRFGPMVRTWCMRYEAKHNYFKRIAAYMGNFTNVALTLAERHQTQICYSMNTECGDMGVVPTHQFLCKQSAIGCGKQVVAGDTEYFNTLKEKEGTLAITDVLYESKKVIICGTVYRLGAVMLTGLSNDLPQFASIQTIVIISLDKIYFLLKKFETITFSSHFHAYEVQRPINAETIALGQNEFQMYLPTHTTKPSLSTSSNGVLYVAPRFILNSSIQN